MAPGPTYTCTAWGDPHYTTFGGLVHDFYEKGLYEHARFTIEPCGCEVVIQTFLAALGSASAIAATAVRVGDTTFEITGGGDVTIRQPYGAPSNRSLQDDGPETAQFCNGGCTLERQNRASWRLHLPGGAGDFLVVPRGYSTMPQGFYYDTWLHVAQSVINRGCASGLCTASCPLPVLPLAACNESSQCYPVPADDSAFDKPTLRELELAHNQPISTRSCPPDPSRDGNIESPSPPSQPPAPSDHSLAATCALAGIDPATALARCDVGSIEIASMCAYDYCALGGDDSFIDAYRDVIVIDTIEKAPRPPPPPPPSPLAPTYLLVYRNQDDCSGHASLNVTLDHSSHNGCTNCWDRCAAGIGGASSYRIVGPGQVAIAWVCIGSFSYASAGFDRGGYARTQDSGCLKNQGGGAFALCHSASFTGAFAADHENALSAVCSP